MAKALWNALTQNHLEPRTAAQWEFSKDVMAFFAALLTCFRLVKPESWSHMSL